jgi:hypothetical protein
MQTLLYAWLAADDHPDEQILPGLYVMKALFEEDFDPALKLNSGGRKSRVERFGELEDEFLIHLKEVIQRMFDPGVPFSQRAHDQTCSYCDYAALCSRNTID